MGSTTALTRTALVDADLICYILGYVFDEYVPDYIVQNKVDDYIEGIVNASRCDSYTCFLTRSSSNFRIDIATVGKYKGNRPPNKPYHYTTVRQHIKYAHDAIESNGCEADDLIANEMIANRDTSVICSIDKDLDTIWGWSYQWGIRGNSGRGLYYVQPYSAHRFLCKQMLMGDSTDNIAGVYGIGDKKAERILQECSTEEEMQERVRQTYINIYGEGEDNPINYQDWRGNWISRTPTEIMGEMYELLFIGTGEDRVRNKQGWCV